MSTEAVLADVEAVPRLVITLLKREPDIGGSLVNLQLGGQKYQIHADARISEKEKSASLLLDLLSNLSGTATFSIWGIGGYRLEGALLNCEFAGDGLGHFTVKVTLAENELRFEDRFMTDQTCLASFITALQSLAG